MKKGEIIDFIAIIIVAIFFEFIKDNINITIPAFLTNIRKVEIGTIFIISFIILTRKKEKIYRYWPIVLALSVIFFSL